MKVTIIDASNLILGRLASHIARRLLKGETIIVVNAEEAVVSGSRKSLVREAKEFFEVGSPKYGPFHPRRPDTKLRRVIRGMLPRDKAKGRMAYKRLKVYVGIPPELRGKPMERIPDADVSRLKGPHIKLGNLMKEIGWKPAK